jgi:DNA recombination-dependent growth factor C
MDHDAYVLPHRVDPSVDFTFGLRVLAEPEEVQSISESIKIKTQGLPKETVNPFLQEKKKDLKLALKWKLGKASTNYMTPYKD